MKKILIALTLIVLVSTMANAHVFGEDSRTKGDNFPVSPQYFNSLYQSEIAKENLVHIECAKNRKWTQNTTSGFLIDVSDYAKNNHISGNFETCNNKVVLSVAHYLMFRDTPPKGQCSIYQGFKTKLGKTTSAKATSNVSFGNIGANRQLTSNQMRQDFAFIEIDGFKNDENPVRSNLKICKRNGIYKADSLILPHMSRYENDKWALQKGLKIKAKITSGTCSKMFEDKEGLIQHNCDMDQRASGAPLLSKGQGNDICALGIQSAEGLTPEKVKTYFAAGLTGNPHFEAKFNRFVRNLSCRK